MNPDRDTLLKVLKSSPHGMSIERIHAVFSVNPHNEEDRKTVWKIGQNLYHLMRQRWVDRDSDRRHFYAV